MDPVLREYCDQLLSEYRYLDFQGIAQVQGVISLDLDETFVPLNGYRYETEDARGRIGLARDILGRLKHEAYPQRLKKLTDGERGLLALIAAELRVRPGAVDASHIWKWLDLQEAGPAGERPLSMAAVLHEHRQAVLLGDPGSGKTTLVKWLARTFAMGPEVVKERLGLDEAPVPIVVPIAAYARACCMPPAGGRGPVAPDASGGCPSDYVEEVHNRVRAGRGTRLAQAIREGQAFLLFDGLDEVPDLNARAEAARRVQALMGAGPAGARPRCLVTSRPFGYDLCRVHDAPHWKLAPFDREQISRFIVGWSRALDRSLHPGAVNREAADAAAKELERAIFEAPAASARTLQDFASNPLLLTILALVQRQHGVLPEMRARLYETAVRTLMETWNRHRSLDRERGVAEIPLDDTLRLWEPVALWMHRRYPGGTAPRAALVERLAGELGRGGRTPEAARATAESYLQAAAQHAGMLLERGPNVFGFLHQTFQEYLAARALVRGAADPHAALQRYFFYPRWREVVLLAAGYLGAVQERVEEATALMEMIRDTTDELEPYVHRHLLLAAAIIADRTPVSEGCYQETLLRLLQVAGEPNAPEGLAQAIAGMAFQAPAPEVLEMAGRAMPKAQDWETRVALLLLFASAPKPYAGVLKRALADDDNDVRALASLLLLGAGYRSRSVRECVELPEVDQAVVDRGVKGVLCSPAVQMALVRLLRDSDAHWNAAEVLHGAGALGEAAQVALVGLLQDADADVRHRAAAVVQDAGVQLDAAQAALVGLLQDADSNVRWRAAETLKEGGTHLDAAQAVLVDYLQDAGAIMPYGAAARLQGTGPLSESAQVTLAGLLQDDDGLVRAQAAETLQRDGTHLDAAQAVLVALLQDAHGIGRMQAEDALHGAGVLGDGAQAALVGLLQGADTHLRYRAAAVLQGAGVQPGAVQEALVGLLQDADSNVRYRAAEALQGVAALGIAAQSALLGRLQDADTYVRYRAAETLLGAGAHMDAARAALVGLLQDDDGYARYLVAQSLLRDGVHVDGAQSALVGLLQGADYMMGAAETLLRDGVLGDAAQSGLVGLLHDADTYVRCQAAEVLLGAGAHMDAARAALVGLLHDADAEVRRSGAKALQGAEALGDAAQAALVGLLQDVDADVRRRAAGTLAYAATREPAEWDDDVPTGPWGKALRSTT